MGEQVFERRTSFNAGEISPWLDPRVDQDKYHMGCRQMENMKPTIYGGCFRRPGSVFLGEAEATISGRVRLAAFEYEVGTTYVLEFGDSTMRVWTTGDNPALIQDPDSPGDPLVVTTPWSGLQLNALQFVQLNDLLFVVHPDHAPRCICRYAANDWRVVKYNPDWPALLPINDRNITLQCTAANATPAAWSAATTYAEGDEVTHEGEDYGCRLESCKNIEPGQHPNWRRWWRVKDGTSTLGIGRRVTVSASKAVFNTNHAGSKWVLIWRRDELKKVLHLSSAVNTTTAGIYCLGEWTAGLFADNSGTGDWNVEVTVQRSKDNKYWFTRKVITGSRTEVQSLLTGTEAEPCFLRLKIAAKSGTIPTQYKAELEVANPDQHGIVRIKSVTNSTTATGVLEFPVPNSDTTKYWHEPAWSAVRGYPRAICLHEGRLWFGGTTYQPTTFWATALDRFEDFRIGVEADRGKEFQVQSDEANAIQWMASHDALIIGTKGAEWFYGQRIGEDLPKLRRNTNYGSAPIQARVVNESLVFVQRSQRKLREFAWDVGREGFAAPDLTLLAEHFGDAQFIQMAIQRNPETIIWLTTTRGELIGLVYERTQNVAGWFRYTTDGIYTSVCAVEGTGEEDQIWVSTARTIDGNEFRSIERFQPDLIRNIKESDQADLIYVDAAKVRTGSPTSTITGLDHLEGKSVSILADGAPHPNQTVTGGEITLQWDASDVIVGLPFTSYLEPTYLETSDPGTITKAFRKRIVRADIEFWKSLGVEISANGGVTWHPIEFRTPEDNMDEVPPLFSGIKQELVEAGSEKQASIILRQTQPLPLNVLSLVMRFTMGTA